MGKMEVYDCVVSLMRDLELLLSSYDRLFSSNGDCELSKEKIEDLYQNVSLMDSLLRDSSSSESDTYDQRLIDQLGGDWIASIARAAANYVDSHTSNAAFLAFGDSAEDPTKSIPNHYLGWDTLLSQVEALYMNDNIDLEVKILTSPRERRRYHKYMMVPHELSTMDTSHPSLTQDGKWVGLQDKLLQMLKKLVGGPPVCEVYEILGSEGIGKTTFARRLYEHPLIASHFDVRVWITLSKQESLEQVLKRLYAAIDVFKSKNVLVQRFYSSRRFLRHKRCFIVLDDLSSDKECSVLMIHLMMMIGQNGSRIIFTNRYKFVHRDISVHGEYIHGLTQTESWDLLRSKIFTNESCPAELLLVGKEIASKCKGVPLVILVVGRLLSNMDITSTIWDEVSWRLDSFIIKVSVNTDNVHDLIYNYFLNHMKAFFHYMEVPLRDNGVHAERKKFGVALQFRTSPVIEENNDLAQVSINEVHQTTGSTADTRVNSMHYFKLPLFARQDKNKLVLHPQVNARNASPSRNVKLVGLDKNIAKLLDKLTRLTHRLEIISISGISGIGKTELARSLYDHPLVVNHFNFCAWATISQDYQLQHVLLEFVSRINNVADIHKRHHEELLAELRGFLKDKRYLIVLDIKGQGEGERFQDFMRYFPDERNSSRIILTRGTVVYPIQIHYHYMCNLHRRESWELLCSKIFPSESCPAELIPTGKRIATKCLGLPMLIVVIAGLLSKMHKTETVWEEVECCLGTLTKITSLFDEYCLVLRKERFHFLRKFIRKVAMMKLKHLSSSHGGYFRNKPLICLYQLKACFLHMDFLPEDHKIHIQRKLLDKAPQMELQQIKQKMSEIIERLKEMRRDILEKPSLNVEDHTSLDTGKLYTTFNASRPSLKKDGEFIGFEEELEEMLSWLTGQQLRLKVFSFTGMAGIGKSTFAKRLYDHPYAVEYFHIRSWVTLSQQYQLNTVLLKLLSCNSHLSDDMYDWSEDELKERLYKSLKGQRYLIVLDDVWEAQAWKDLSRAFPDDNNGSRIILTSRLSDVCFYASSDLETRSLRFLSPEESWELLCLKIFQNESCPPELEAVGKIIASKCQGLPLALVVVGGLLADMTKKLATWKEVAKSVSSLVMEDPEHCQNILALSYNHLSDPLKACLLYIGNFPEDHEIHAQKLMCLWIADGFIQPKEEKSLEEVAEHYLHSLICRSLVMEKQRSSKGTVKVCCIHDLTRDFCLREAKKENFICVINSHMQDPLVDLLNQRRVTFHSGIRKYISSEGLILFTRSHSFLCYEPLGPTDLKSCSGMYFKLLKVLDISKLHLVSLPVELVSLTHLRYLAMTIQTFVHISELFRLHSLQAIFVCCEWDGCLPKEFWKMLELRHLYLKGSCVFSVLVDKVLPDSGPLNILHKLQTLSTIRPINCTKQVFRSMPNLRNLGVYETEDDNCFRGWTENLVFLEELERLKYVFFNPFARPTFRELHPSWGIVFPPKLMKLTLSGTRLPWEDMKYLAVLPNLEVLKLKNYAFTGPIWEQVEQPTKDGFCCLKYLFISGTDLKRWEADFSPFPRLQHLVLRHCIFLEEIPSVIGEAPQLEKIELHGCSRSAATSARNIQEEQQNYGNDFLTVYVTQGPSGKLSGAGTDVATTSRGNEASYTTNYSHDSGATAEINSMPSTSNSKEKMPMVAEGTYFSYNEESEEESYTGRAAKATTVATDRWDDVSDDDDLDCYLDDLQS